MPGPAAVDGQELRTCANGGDWLMAWQPAPPAVAGLAWFALAGPGALSGTESIVAYVLGGYAVLMVLAQVRLSLVYARLSFTPGFWAFSYPAAVADGLAWLALKKPPGPRPTRSRPSPC